MMSTPSENFARMVGRDMRGVEDKTRQIYPADQTAFAVTDQEGHAAFSVTSTGTTVLGDSEIAADLPGFRIMDTEDMVALEVRRDGSVLIPDLVGRVDGGAGESPEPPESPESAKITDLHIFIAAGQSNMFGAGNPIEGPESPRIMQFGARRRVIEQAPLLMDMQKTVAWGTSPATFFAEQYLASQPPHVGVLIVAAAASGTGFRGTPTDPAPEWTYTWTKGAAWPTRPEYDLYSESVKQTKEAIAAAKAEGYLPILQGVLWLQGEHNAGAPDRNAETYDVMLDTLISDYRSDLGEPRLPFVLARMNPEGIEDEPLRAVVDAHHVATPARVPFTGIADSPRGTTNDRTHFTTLGNRILGNLYLRAWYQALGNTHI